MDYILLVKIAESEDNLCTNELNGMFLESFLFIDIVVNVSSWQVFEEEIDSEVILEYEVHWIHKWMLSLEKNILLIFNILDLLLLEQQVFVDSLHGVHFPHLWAWYEEHFSEWTFINHFSDLEVFQSDAFALRTWFSDEAVTLRAMQFVSFFIEVSLTIVFWEVWLK